MNSPSRDFSRSAFENVFQILPQGHDKALKQAFYNTAATLFIALVFGIAIAVYYILQPFLKPLLWAILCGTFLFPFKYKLTKISREWLKNLQSSGTPLIVGITLLPITLVDNATTHLINYMWNNLLLIVVSCFSVPLLTLFFSLWPLATLFNVITVVSVFVYDLLTYFSSLWIWTLLLAFLLGVYFLWDEHSSIYFKLLSIPVWTCIIFHIASLTNTGVFRIPLTLFFLILLIAGITSEIVAFIKNKSFHFSTITDECEAEESNIEVQNKIIKTPDNINLNCLSTQDLKHPKSNQSHAKSPSSVCIWVILWAFCVIHLWLYKFIVIILPLLIAVFVLKKLDTYLGIRSTIRIWISETFHKVAPVLSEDPRFDLLLPKPIRILFSWVIKGDEKIVSSLIKLMDKLVSILIIVILILSITGATIFSGMEVHRESMHLINIGTNILNKSQHPELTKWLPDDVVMTNALDSMMNNAYIYGREWIASKMNGLLDGTEENKERVAKQVLKLWDDVYSKWRKDNGTKNAMFSNVGLKTGTQDMMDFISMYGSYKKLRMNNLNIFTIAKENVDLFMSVIKTLWTVAMSNLAMLVKIFTSMTSVIFGGGTAILNLIISIIVFLTTLFYLLSSSAHQYRPIELFSTMSPSFSNSDDSLQIGKAIQDAIRSVFLASCRMAIFYGLYTYVTHTLFGVQIVFIPSALAAVFAAVPLFGTYMASLPAVIELWFVYGMKLEAILFFVAHYLPTLIVDTLFYSEIKGGHPYLTGLAIAGGIFWLGLEGAIIGPVLLCCFIVAMHIYQAMLKMDVSPTSVQISATPLEKRNKFITRTFMSQDFSL